MREEDMYPVVEGYFRDKLRNLGFDQNILSSNASQTDLSLPLFGAYIKPDVYAVGENKDGISRISIGEGKLTYKGRDLDGVIWQGTSDQRFAHYVYVFFPKESINDSEVAVLNFLKQECNKFSLGLLLVDVRSKNVEEVLPADLSPFFLDKNSITDFEVNTLMVRNKIEMNLGVSKEAEYIHLTTLRDLSILLSRKEQWKESEIFTDIGIVLLPEYQNIEKSSKRSSIGKYDARVRNSIIEGDYEKFKEIMRRNLNTLLFFDLISISNDEIYVKPLCRVMATLDGDNKFYLKTNDKIEDLLTCLLLTTEGTKKLAEAIYDILEEHSEIPVWTRKGYCPKYNKCNRECGFKGKWTPEGQPFPDELKYDRAKKVHNCEISGESFEFDKLTVTSLLYCLYGLLLPEKSKILISESKLVKQKGKPHLWSLGIS